MYQLLTMHRQTIHAPSRSNAAGRSTGGRHVLLHHIVRDGPDLMRRGAVMIAMRHAACSLTSMKLRDFLSPVCKLLAQVYAN